MSDFKYEARVVDKHTAAVLTRMQSTHPIPVLVADLMHSSTMSPPPPAEGFFELVDVYENEVDGMSVTTVTITNVDDNHPDERFPPIISDGKELEITQVMKVLRPMPGDPETNYGEPQWFFQVEQTILGSEAVNPRDTYKSVGTAGIWALKAAKQRGRIT
jgi:hypothetical protein